jgi:hypothetical protein
LKAPALSAASASSILLQSTWLICCTQARNTHLCLMLLLLLHNCLPAWHHKQSFLWLSAEGPNPVRYLIHQARIKLFDAPDALVEWSHHQMAVDNRNPLQQRGTRPRPLHKVRKT